MVSEIPRLNVLGVGISVLNLRTALAALEGALAAGQRGYVTVTPVHGVMECRHDPELRRIFNRSLLTTPDGMPLVWLGRLAGHREMGRVYGPELMERVFEWTRSSGHTHFLYGGQEGVAEALRARLETRFPGARVVGTYTPPFRPLNEEEQADLERQVASLQPDFFWVGISTPKQERFMAENWKRLQAGIMIGVGAAFDFHAGRVRQAPRWIQRSGFEWLYRLAREPRRLWKRYATANPLFLWSIALQALGIRKYEIERE